jgi:hypothetical protein
MLVLQPSVALDTATGGKLTFKSAALAAISHKTGDMLPATLLADCFLRGIRTACQHYRYPKPVDVVTHHTLPDFIRDRGQWPFLFTSAALL